MCLNVCIDAQDETSLTDSIITSYLQSEDSIVIDIKTNNPQLQLSFLMQGLNVNVLDSTNNVLFYISLPSAADVKGKVKHHPNEVKATIRDDNMEVRPDLTPLVDALNNSHSVSINVSNDTLICYHRYFIEKTDGTLKINIRILSKTKAVPFMCELSSTPLEIGGQEFNGRKLSKENRLRSGGMGNAPISNNDIRRNIHIFTYLIPL